MYFIVRQHCCEEGKTWSRQFAGNDKDGYATLEEAIIQLNKIEKSEKIEKEAELQKEIFMAEAEEREPKEEDGWSRISSIVELVDIK